MTGDEAGFEPMWLDEVTGDELVFPDPRYADPEGLLAFGGDLSVDRLLFAYANGIFPWFDPETPPLWWSPDPRCVLPLDGMHVPARLARRMRRGDYRVTWNRAFERVMRECGERRSDGTWVSEPMIAAYVALFEIGHAHSLEVWCDDELVGGVYGVQLGGLFAAESMFHARTDMSKIALVHLVQVLRIAGIAVLDVQLRTTHLAQFGCVEIPRADYLDRIAIARDLQVTLPPEGVVRSSS